MRCEHCPRGFLIGPGTVVLSGLIADDGDCKKCLLNQLATIDSLNQVGLVRRDAASVEEIHAILKKQLIQPGYRLKG